MEDGKKMNKLNVLYEDNHVIVVEKGYNIPVQEDDSKDKDLLNMVKDYVKLKYNKPGNVYIGLVHRLDRPVGGIIVFARTSKAASRLSEQIRNKMINKNYIALVNNHIPEKGTLIDYIVKDPITYTSKIVDKSVGKESILEYKLIKYIKDKSLIDINLITGRHHQIRIQLANAGYPIYGDQRYGKDEKKIQIYLYAYKLSFYHPITNKLMEFENKPNWIGELQ
ncbi:MAG: RluA family pseudouridine synthase [Bacilli bacterium]|nr:RluA family pseudouridine synthase [Bacilli bacterium]